MKRRKLLTASAKSQIIVSVAKFISEKSLNMRFLPALTFLSVLLSIAGCRTTAENIGVKDTNATVANAYYEPPPKVRTRRNPNVDTGNEWADSLSSLKNDILECDAAIDQLIKTSGRKGRNGEDSYNGNMLKMKLYVRLDHYNDKSSPQDKAELTEVCKEAAAKLENYFPE